MDDPADFSRGAVTVKTCIAAVALIVTFAAGAALGAPLDVVNEKYSGIRQLISRNMDRASFDRAVKAELDSFVDYEELSKRTLGANWAGLKQKDRARFVAGFKQMIQRSYVKKFNPDARFTLEIDPAAEQAADGTVVVKSMVKSGKSEAAVNYAFHQVKGKWWAFDVIIDDVSMMKNYRRQFNKIWETEGFEGLMKKIDRKNLEAAGK